MDYSDYGSQYKTRTNTAKNAVTNKFSKGPHKARDETKRGNPPPTPAPVGKG